MRRLLVILLVVLQPSVVHAADEKPDCDALTVFVEAIARATVDVALAAYRTAAIVFPHVGVVASIDALPAVHLSWPWAIPVGPVVQSEDVDFRCVDDLAIVHRRHRVVVEPAIELPDVRLSLRPGYRIYFHEHDRNLGWGLGLGSTVKTDLDGTFGASVSPELLVRGGECCFPGYILVTVRYDRFFGIEPTDTLTYGLGFTYF